MPNQSPTRPITAFSSRSSESFSAAKFPTKVILEDSYTVDFVTSSNLDEKTLILQAPPRQVRYRTRVVRVSKSAFSWASSEYRLLTELGTPVLFAKKVVRGKCFSIFMNDQTKLGKLNSNLIGSEFVLYSPGDTRRELACIGYENRLFRSASTKTRPRDIIVSVPSVLNPAPYYVNADAMVKAVQQPMAPSLGIDILKNREARWIPSTASYELPFTQLDIIEASPKNFILVANNGDHVFEFAKLPNGDFMLDFASPISPLAAFAIAISSLNFKLCCE